MPWRDDVRLCTRWGVFRSPFGVGGGYGGGATYLVGQNLVFSFGSGFRQRCRLVGVAWHGECVQAAAPKTTQCGVYLGSWRHHDSHDFTKCDGLFLLLMV